MKKIFLFNLLTLVFNCTFSQNIIEGKFCNTDTWNWYCFEFYSDSSFKWSIWAYGGGEEIKGKYQLNENKLTLIYNNKIDSIYNNSKRLLRCDSVNKKRFNNFISHGNIKGTKEFFIIKKTNKKKFVIKKENSKIKYLFIRNGVELIPPLKGEKEFCE